MMEGTQIENGAYSISEMDNLPKVVDVKSVRFAKFF